MKPGQLLKLHPRAQADEFRLLRLESDLGQRLLLAAAVQGNDVIEHMQAEVDLLGFGSGATEGNRILYNQAITFLQASELQPEDRETPGDAAERVAFKCRKPADSARLPRVDIQDIQGRLVAIVITTRNVTDQGKT